MKIMGLDYGSKTVGVAISDDLLITAQPVETIQRESENKLRRTLARINELVSENHVQKIVLGLPLLPDGDVGERAEKTLEFKTMLEKRTGLDVILVDERYTTDASRQELREMGVARRDRKNYLDQLAACHILEEYLHAEELSAVKAAKINKTNMEENKIVFTDEDGTKEEFFVIEETRMGDVSYILVCESMEEETDAYIMKDISAKEESEAVYVFVEDDTELEAVADIFEQLLDEEEELV